jgi:hypothetical protein
MQSGIVGVRKQPILARPVIGCRRRLSRRSSLGSLGVARSVEFHKPFARSGSRRRIKVGRRRLGERGVSTRV